MKWHPASYIYPMLGSDRLTELVEDIKKNGLIESIVMHQGMVLDGRNRYLACGMAKVKPRFAEWGGECRIPELYVYSRNGARRDLTVGQRAVAAAKLVPFLTPGAKERQMAAGEHGEEGGRGRKKTLPVNCREGFVTNNTNKLGKKIPSKNEDDAKQHENETCEIAGKMMGVSGTMVRRALIVRDADPVAFEWLGKGESTVNSEYTRVRGLPGRTHRPDTVKAKRKPVATGNRLIVRQNAAKRRLTRILGEIDGATGPLAEVTNIDYVRAACTERELRHLAEMAFGSAQRLRWMGSQLKKRSEVK